MVVAELPHVMDGFAFIETEFGWLAVLRKNGWDRGWVNVNDEIAYLDLHPKHDDAGYYHQSLEDAEIAAAKYLLLNQ